MLKAKPSTTQPQEKINRLEHFPIPFFAVIMGLLGFTLALHAFERNYNLEALYSHIALVISGIALALISGIYLIKAIKHPNAVKQEWHHPVKISFFPAISIAFLLLATALLEIDRTLAQFIWIGAATLQGLFFLGIFASWIGHRSFQPAQLSPAWFIPAVGNVIVPVAGVPLGFTDISWLFFSAGLLFWIVLLTLIVNRLLFHDPLPGRFIPTLMILVAPPSVAYISWLRLNSGEDAFGQILISLAYVFALIVLTQIGKLKALPFTLSWWALSFPVAALSIASFTHANATNSIFYKWIGVGTLALLGFIIVFLVVRTMIAIANRGICLPE